MLELLADARIGDPYPIEGWLLRARALLELGRPADVAAELAPLLPAIPNADERATAAMLHAAALATLAPSRGIELLAAIAQTARRERAHPAIRAEIAYIRAVADARAGALEAADRFAVEAQCGGHGLVSVRATQLRASVAESRPRASRYADALELYRAAAAAYARCREVDGELAAALAQRIAGLEQTLRSAQVPGTHRTRHGRRGLQNRLTVPVPSSPAALRLHYDDAYLYALDGEGVPALALMREAEDAAPTAAWRVWAQASCAALAAFFLERAAARTFADRATANAHVIDWNAAGAVERGAFLHLAEVYASLGEAATASAALREFDGLAPCPHAERDGGDADPRQAGWYAHVAGLVRRGEGDLRGAAESLHAAVDVFHAHGCRWREVLSLIELDALRGPAPGEFLDRAVAMIAEHFPVSFLVRRLSPWSRAAIDPVVGTLTPAELDVLRHMLDGRCQRDIAHLTGRAYNTVRTQVQGLHRKLGTSSDLQIVAACARRGIGAPSWPFTVRHEPS